MKTTRLTIISVVMLTLNACGFKTIDTGDVGIPTTFGKITGEPVTEGLHFYNPFTSALHEIDTHVLRMDGQTEAYTKDVQETQIKYVLNYQLRKIDAAKIYATLGEDWANRVIPQIVLGTLKEVVGQWDAVDLIQNRQKAGVQVSKAITDVLATKSIDVSRFEITDLEYSKEFNKAIEAKVIAQQSAIREQNHTVEIQQVANQTVISAKAQAESMQIRAQALAQNPKLVEWEAVQKWDGHLPEYMLGGATPFINVTAPK